MRVTANRIDNVSGAIRADDRLTLTGSGAFDNTQGLISSQGTVIVVDANLAAKVLELANGGGTLIAGRDLLIESARLTGSGNVLSLRDVTIRLTGDHTQQNAIQANRAASLETTGKVTLAAKLLAGDAVTLKAGTIEMGDGGEARANSVRLIATEPHTLVNRGLIDGVETVIETITLRNLGTGRIYGDHVAIGVTTLDNEAENGVAPVIAARNRLDIGAQTMNNREHALIFSAGDIAIGSSLNAAKQATGQASVLNNRSATIEALGALDIVAEQINNTNEHFSTQTAEVSRASVQEFQLSGSPNRYGPSQIRVFNSEVDFLVTPEGQSDSWNRYDYTRVTSETQLKTSDPAQILAGGAMRITADSLLNDKSRVIAGGVLTANIGTLTNTGELRAKPWRYAGEADRR